MRAQEKNIRGFNLLELLVVIAIMSIISAVAYPSFSSWKSEREIRNAATKIKNLFTNINSQVQNGSFAFAQVEVTNQFGDLAIISKGLNMDKLTERIRKVDNWNSDINVRCDADQTGDDYTNSGVIEGWDEAGATREYANEEGDEEKDEDEKKSKWSVSDNLQVGFLSFDDIVANFAAKKSGTICFSKDGTWYSADGEFESSNTIIEAFYVCNRTATITECDVNSLSQHKYVFEINWSRFGNITMEKWNNDEREWVQQ